MLTRNRFSDRKARITFPYSVSNSNISLHDVSPAKAQSLEPGNIAMSRTFRTPERSLVECPLRPSRRMRPVHGDTAGRTENVQKFIVNSRSPSQAVAGRVHRRQSPTRSYSHKSGEAPKFALADLQPTPK
jgi:hypothetical protein